MKASFFYEKIKRKKSSLIKFASPLTSKYKSNNKNPMKKVSNLIFLLTFSALMPVFVYASSFSPVDNMLLAGSVRSEIDTLKPKIGDWISIEMRYTAKKNGADTMLYNSKDFLKGMPLLIQLPPSDFNSDLYENIATLSEGDSGTFHINSDSLFLKTFRMPMRPIFVDSNTNVTFHIKLISIDSPEELMAKEVTDLKKYLEVNKITVQPRPSGIYFLQTLEGAGLKIDTGCMVTVSLKISFLDGKVLFNSTDRPDPIKFKYGKRFDTPGVDEGIGLMKGGSKATIIVPSKMAFGDQGRGALIPPYSALVYEVEITDVQSKADFEKEQAELKLKNTQEKEAIKKGEAQQLQKFLADNKITVAPTSSGLYYIETVKGTGVQPVPGNKVRVHYTGKLLNGKKFDSSHDRNTPFEFDLGKGQVIKGWDEGIAMMKQGGKAVLVIPYNIAYGERSMGEIPPYATLVFEVELFEVNPGVNK